MSESLNYPFKSLAEVVERKALKEFGPEKLTKEIIASALNLSPEKITEKEWAEIYEFAVNAGADLIRSAITRDVPETLSNDDLKALTHRIKKNTAGLIPSHDLFHAAETYRLTKGTKASAEFIEVGARERYADPAPATSELYPLLFFVVPRLMNAPLPVLLSNTNGRERIANFLVINFGNNDSAVQQSIKKLTGHPPPQTAVEKQREFEDLVELIVTSNSRRRLDEKDKLPLSEEEVAAFHAVFTEARKNPAPHYQSFAEKVFSQEDFSENPRLFLDELLTCIRQVPSIG